VQQNHSVVVLLKSGKLLSIADPTFMKDALFNSKGDFEPAWAALGGSESVFDLEYMLGRTCLGSITRAYSIADYPAQLSSFPVGPFGASQWPERQYSKYEEVMKKLERENAAYLSPGPCGYFRRIDWLRCDASLGGKPSLTIHESLYPPAGPNQNWFAGQFGNYKKWAQLEGQARELSAAFGEYQRGIEAFNMGSG
jgi:hypothetical protein